MTTQEWNTIVQRLGNLERENRKLNDQVRSSANSIKTLNSAIQDLRTKLDTLSRTTYRR